MFVVVALPNKRNPVMEDAGPCVIVRNLKTLELAKDSARFANLAAGLQAEYYEHGVCWNYEGMSLEDFFKIPDREESPAIRDLRIGMQS